MKILVAEDEPKIGAYLQQGLSEAGFAVERVENGSAALQRALGEAYDLLILDVMMPGLDGWQVLRSLKEDEATAGIPVIIVSVLKDKQVGFSIGASEYLQKPVVDEELVRIARHLTTPAPERKRRTFAEARRVVLFSESDELSNRLSSAFEPCAFRVSPLDPKSLGELAGGSTAPPDLAIIDFRNSYLPALTLLHRFRLFRPLDAIPLVGITGDGADAHIRFESPGLLDAILPSSSVDAVRIRAALSGH